jgi:hypothetical protein
MHLNSVIVLEKSIKVNDLLDVILGCGSGSHARKNHHHPPLECHLPYHSPHCCFHFRDVEHLQVDYYAMDFQWAEIVEKEEESRYGVGKQGNEAENGIGSEAVLGGAEVVEVVVRQMIYPEVPVLARQLVMAVGEGRCQSSASGWNLELV